MRKQGTNSIYNDCAVTFFKRKIREILFSKLLCGFGSFRRNLFGTFFSQILPSISSSVSEEIMSLKILLACAEVGRLSGSARVIASCNGSINSIPS